MITKEGIEALLPLFEWVIRASWQSAILVIAILVMQWLLRKRLPARWRFNLWLLVVARLLIPFSPESAFSLFNLVQVEPSAVIEQTRRAAPPLPLPKKEALAPSAPAEETAPQRGKHRANLPTPFPAPPHHPWNLVEWALIVWLLGSGGLAIHLSRSMLRLSRKVAEAKRVIDPATLKILDHCRQQMNVHFEIRLFETERVQSPALFGLLRPVLLLPPGLTARFSPVELRYIFLHELAHIKRQDLVFNWLLAILQILHWFNPVLWFGFSRLRADRELACDALALASAREDEAKAYGLTIIKMLETLSHPSSLPGLVGIMEDKNQLKQRIFMIAHSRKSILWSLLASGLIAILAVTGLTDAISPPSKTEKKPSQAELLAALIEKDPMTIRVVDNETGQPVKDAAILFPYSKGVSAYGGALPLTKVDIMGTMRFPRMSGRIGFAVLHPDYAPIAAGWPEFTKDGKKFSPEIPNDYVVRLTRGIEIGGVVRDARGNPIAGVRLEIKGSVWMGSEEMPYPFYNSLFGSEAPVTDAEGRWKCRHFPEGIELVEFSLVAPNNSCRQFHTEPPAWAPSQLKGEVLKMDDLRRGSAEVIWSNGIDVRGTVRDLNGKPLAGAMLTEIDNRHHVKPLSIVRADQDGRFEFLDRDPHQIIIKASSPGCATLPVVVDIREGMPEIEVTLQPAVPLKLRVVDEKGKPLAGARIVSPEIRWTTKTDGKGRAVWNGAPLIPQLYYFDAEEHGTITKRLTPGKKEQKIVVPKDAKGNVAISIRAFDEAGNPIQAFKVSSVHEQTSNPIGNGQNGLLTMEVPYSKIGKSPYRLKVESPGFESYTTAPFYTPHNADFSAMLIKAGPLTGIVLDPSGNLVKRAMLVFPAETGSAFWATIHLRGQSNMPGVTGSGFLGRTTDEEGHYSFISPGGDPPVIIVAAEGIAETTVSQLRRSSTIRLKAWGRIEGTLIVNSRPGSGALVRMEGLIRNDYGLNIDTFLSVDEKGRFVMEQAPPATVTLLYSIPVEEGMSPQSHPFEVKVAPGETARVTYAVSGRRVNGRIKLKSAYPDFDWQKGTKPKLLSARRVEGRRDVPPIYDDYVREADYLRALEAWRSSAAVASSTPAIFGVQFKEDGSFYIEAVPEGVYNLEISFSHRDAKGSDQKIGILKREVIVPAGASDSPVDLGVLEVGD